MHHCLKCDRHISTAKEVIECGTCSTDGTANEIPKDMADDATMEAVLERKPGLGARFVHEADPPVDAGGYQQPAEKKKRKAPKKKATKPAPRKKPAKKAKPKRR